MKRRLSRRIQIILLLVPVFGLIISAAGVAHFAALGRERARLHDRLVRMERVWMDFLYTSQRLTTSSELAYEIDAWIMMKESSFLRFESFLASDIVGRFIKADDDYGPWLDRLESLYAYENEQLKALEANLLKLSTVMEGRPELSYMSLLELIEVESSLRTQPDLWFAAYRALEEINTAVVLVSPTFSSLFTAFREEISADQEQLYRLQNRMLMLLLFWGPILIVLLFYFRYRQLKTELKASKDAEEAARSMQERLEERVRERTGELENALEEYGRINSELIRTNTKLEEALDTIRSTRDVMVQQEKLAALGQLVAGLAHEVNTPLGVSLTAATYIQRGLKAKAGEVQLDESTELLVRNLKRSADIVRSFKQLAADQAGMPRRVFDLAEYLATLVSGLKPGIEASECSLSLNLPEKLMLDSYPGIFSFAVSTLVNNALEHAYGNGCPGGIVLEVTATEEKITLQCRDFGKGMDASELKHIFDPFFTSNRGGGSTGLGLSITHNYITQILGGEISCSSEPGSGSLFTITIPVHRDGSSLRSE